MSADNTRRALTDRAPGVTIAGATLSYDDAVLFDDLHLRLDAGQVTCLLGPSGVGKSSLLRLIAGLTPLAKLRDLSCDDGRSPLGRIAYMAQQDALLPWLSVLDNVMLGSRLRGSRADEAKASALLAEVGLEDAATLRPAALSGGMRQRAALARTLMEDRPIVLMDEPFSAVDALTRLKLQDLAARLLRGRTVLLVTHDPLEALRIGDAVLVMSGIPAKLRAARLPDLPVPRDPATPDVQAAVAEIYALLETRIEAPSCDA